MAWQLIVWDLFIWTAILPPFSSGSEDEANGIVVDASGCAYLGGTTEISGTGQFAAVKLSHSGLPVWTAVLSSFGFESNDLARAIAIDASGCIYLGGSVISSLPDSTAEFAAAKLDNEGNTIWQFVAPSIDQSRPVEVVQGIVIDSDRSVVLGGIISNIANTDYLGGVMKLSQLLQPIPAMPARLSLFTVMAALWW